VKILVAVKQVASLDEDVRDPQRLARMSILTSSIRDLNEWDGLLARRGDEDSRNRPLRRSRLSSCAWGPLQPMRRCASVSPKALTGRLRIWTTPSRGRTRSRSPVSIAAVAVREAPDMLFAGVQSADHAFASTGIATAALLKWPHAAVVAHLIYTPGAKTAGSAASSRAGVARDADRVPRRADHTAPASTRRLLLPAQYQQAAAKPIEVCRLRRLGVKADEVGAGGSLSRVRRMYVPEKGRAQMIEGSVTEQAARLAGNHQRLARVMRERCFS